MLHRVLEPEVMSSPEEAIEYDAMDHREVNSRFVENLLSAADEANSDIGGPILDLGTGTAQIPIELCRQSASVRVLATDASRSMLDRAQQNTESAGYSDRIDLEVVDAKRLPYADNRFGFVVSNSIVHHIPEPLVVLREAWRVAVPGGLVFFRDLLRPPDEPTLAELVASYASDATTEQRRLFAESLGAALTLEEMRQLVVKLGCKPSSVQATSDRHWTWSARKP